MLDSTKMLPPSREEGCSANENAGFPVTTNMLKKAVQPMSMRVFLARERVLSSCMSLARIRDNLQELGMKTSNSVLFTQIVLIPYRILHFSHNHQPSCLFNFFMLQRDFLSLFGLFPSYLTSHIIGK